MFRLKSNHGVEKKAISKDSNVSAEAQLASTTKS